MEQGQKKDNKSGKAGIILKFVIAGVAAVGLFMFYQSMMSQRELKARWEKIDTEMISKEAYEEAIPELEKLLTEEDISAKLEDLVKKDIAFCALQLAEDPGQSIAESAKWIRIAKENDPSLLEPRHEQTLKASEATGGPSS
ncbi:MAG: hypothetical protein R3336_05450 [Phycisphaeraceae bacterium]|nr:hypothetical protein [Phycisphaeraceae bacterium]